MKVDGIVWFVLSDFIPRGLATCAFIRLMASRTPARSPNAVDKTLALSIADATGRPQPQPQPQRHMSVDEVCEINRVNINNSYERYEGALFRTNILLKC
jgi:hypothetical protein